MLKLTYHIKIGNYRLQTLKSVSIKTSVLNLSDTATIELPAQYLNRWQHVESNLEKNDEVSISLGYNGENEVEFKGYLKSIKRNNKQLTLECEDALCLLDKSVADKEYKSIGLRALLTDIVQQVDGEITVMCDYDFTYEKMVVFKSTALDVVKKIHEETKANIWFDGKTLHVHPVYQEQTDVKPWVLDTERNVQSNDLEWVDRSDNKVLVEVKHVDADGKVNTKQYGVDGGKKETRYVKSVNESDLMRVAENEYNLWNYSGYEGTLTGWLVPRVKAGESVRLIDRKRDETGIYYVTDVEVEFGQNGAKRKVSLGRRLG